MSLLARILFEEDHTKFESLIYIGQPQPFKHTISYKMKSNNPIWIINKLKRDIHFFFFFGYM